MKEELGADGTNERKGKEIRKGKTEGRKLGAGRVWRRECLTGRRDVTVGQAAAYGLCAHALRLMEAFPPQDPGIGGESGDCL